MENKKNIFLLQIFYTFLLVNIFIVRNIGILSLTVSGIAVSSTLFFVILREYYFKKTNIHLLIIITLIKISLIYILSYFNQINTLLICLIVSLLLFCIELKLNNKNNVSINSKRKDYFIRSFAGMTVAIGIVAYSYHKIIILPLLIIIAIELKNNKKHYLFFKFTIVSYLVMISTISIITMAKYNNNEIIYHFVITPAVLSGIILGIIYIKKKRNIK